MGAPGNFSDPIAKEQTSGLIGIAIQEYKTQPHTPELINRFWQTFLDISIKRQALAIPVPVVSCDRTQKELEKLRNERKMWIPETKLTYPQLGKIFPKMASGDVVENSLSRMNMS